MNTNEDYVGSTASPDVLTVSQAVQSMMMDMSQDERDAVEQATQQAMDQPEDFIRYMIIVLQEYRKLLDTIVGALVRREILRAGESDDAPSA